MELIHAQRNEDGFLIEWWSHNGNMIVLPHDKDETLKKYFDLPKYGSANFVSPDGDEPSQTDIILMTTELQRIKNDIRNNG
jgi:hypothetical protein